MNNIGIIVIAYKNLNSLSRLLNRLNIIEYNQEDVTLLISVDNSGVNTVSEFADNYGWKHGTKYVIHYDERQGLKKHILKCGNYIGKYNLDAAIIFEDDIYPSENFYEFAKQSIKKYKEDDRIAGISLYSWHKNRYNQSFYPLKTNSDVYFIKLAQSWGQVWIKDRWEEFYKWYEENENMDFSKKDYPVYLDLWGDNSWLKYHIAYCIEMNKYFVVPYEARSTCFSEVGEHTTKQSNINQVELSMRYDRDLILPSIDENEAVYDSFYENENLYKILEIDEDYLTVDLYGTKNFVETRYLLTKRVLNYKILKSWGDYLIPHEMNIINGVSGKGIYLYDRECVEKQDLAISEGVDYSRQRFRILSNWIEVYEGKKGLSNCLLLENINSVAIYGYGVMGKHLYKLLQTLGINVKYAIDKRESGSKDEINIYRIEDAKPKVDLVIVTILEGFDEIVKLLDGEDNIIKISDIKFE